MEPNYINNFEIKEKLGQGAYGVVYKAKNLSSGKIVALKIIDMRSMSNVAIRSTEHEIQVLENISRNGCHENVVCYYSHFHDKENNTYIIETEYIEGMTLDEYHGFLISSKGTDRGEREFVQILRGILNGLVFLHENNIIHNDIKPGNIMVTKNGVPKVIDLGLSCTSTRDNLRDTFSCNGGGGTGYYLPPEYLTENVRLPVSDIWALGISMYTIRNQWPFGLKRNIGDLTQLLTQILRSPLNKLERANPITKMLTVKMLTKNPYNRPNAEQSIELLNKLVRDNSSQNDNMNNNMNNNNNDNFNDNNLSVSSLRKDALKGDSLGLYSGSSLSTLGSSSLRNESLGGLEGKYIMDGNIDLDSNNLSGTNSSQNNSMVSVDLNDDNLNDTHIMNAVGLGNSFNNSSRNSFSNGSRNRELLLLSHLL